MRPGLRARVLLASPPIYGHVSPIVTVARGLVGRGFAVDVLTGTRFRRAVEEAGAGFLPLPAAVDFDDADLDAFLPGRDQYSGLAALRHDMIGMFARVIPGQARAVTSALARDDYVAVLADVAFGGTMPLLLAGPAATRPPILGLSSVPVTMTSVDTAPFGLAITPAAGPLGRTRNRVLNALVNRVLLRSVNRALGDALSECGVTGAHPGFFDSVGLFDHVFQLSVPGLEYPRRELSDVEFLGPLRSAPPAARARPDWWAALDSGVPVVHVTQGTIDNHDPGRLIVPAIRALADDDVIVVACTGGRDTATIASHFPDGLPANAHVAEFLPYDVLLPLTSVVVTNGGFGGVQQALRHGLPLVLAGSSEDKPEVAARVAWAGAGVNLRTGDPRPEQIRAAVRLVRHDRSYRTQARRLADEAASLGDPIDRIAVRLAEISSVQDRSTAGS
jgi:UDP:flavonoid glycosyltransferase YjiC (YdhE family)